MRILGLSPRIKKPLTTSSCLLTNVLPTPSTIHPNSSPQTHQTKKHANKNLETTTTANAPKPVISSSSSPSSSTSTSSTANTTLTTTTSNTNLPLVRRRLSATSSNLFSPCPSTYSSISTQHTQHTSSFLKSLRPSNLVLVEPQTTRTTFFDSTSSPTPLTTGPLSIARLNSAAKSNSDLSSDIYMNGGSGGSALVRRRSSLTGLRRMKSFLGSESDANNETITVGDRSNGTRRVSFGQIELNQLEIPMVK